MAHKPETIAAVRHSYVFDKLPLTQAAAVHKVALGTARRWKNKAAASGDNWEKARASASMSATHFEEMMASMLNDFVTLHKSTVEEVVNRNDLDAMGKVGALNSLADSLSKFIAASGKASPRLNRLSFAMEILQALGNFIAETYPQHADAFAEILEPFGREVSKRYG